MDSTNAFDGSAPAARKPGPDKPKSWALKAAMALAVAGAIAFLAVACQAGRPPEPEGYQRFAKGALTKLIIDPKAPAQPDTQFLTGENQPASLKDFRGKVVMVNLWATWCGPCVTEMPTLGALQATYRDKGLVVMPISVDRLADRDNAKADLAKLGGGALAFYGDHTYRIAYDLKAEGFPTTILYGRDGRELARLAGGADWNSSEAHALVEAALAEK